MPRDSAPPPVEFAAVAPAPPLAAFVEMLWAVRGAGSYQRAVVLPNGALQLMFNLGRPHHVLAFGGRRDRRAYRRAWIAGLQDQPLTIEAPPVTDLVAVRFRPGGAHAFLPVPLSSLTGDVIEATDLLGAEVGEISGRLAELPERARQFALVEDWLVRRLRPREPHWPLVQQAVRALSAPARVPIARLCDDLGVSNKHLIDVFRQFVGLPPQTLARIHRFHRALGALHRTAAPSFASVAIDCNYCDQAHLNREFARFAAVTPTQFLARAAEDGESLVGE
jgi:AraC-like DNA-binding protein